MSKSPIIGVRHNLDPLAQDATTVHNNHTYNYSYDAVDNILAHTEAGSPTTYTYDAASRITTAIFGAGISTYAYL